MAKLLDSDKTQNKMGQNNLATCLFSDSDNEITF